MVMVLPVLKTVCAVCCDEDWVGLAVVCDVMKTGSPAVFGC